MKDKLLKLTLLIAAILFLCGFSWNTQTDTLNNTLQMRQILRQTHRLKPNILQLGITAYERAKEAGLAKKPILTIIDYTLASTKRRFWVIDLSQNRVLYRALVAHGKGSGNDFAHKFSDQPGTEASSIGVYLTGNTYFGRDGYSLYLYGLDKGFNDKAYSRTIVIHQAWYVSDAFIKKYGRLGRSWGCPALEEGLGAEIINIIKDGSIILAYYPDKTWETNSKFVKGAQYTLIMDENKIWQPG